MPAVDSSERKRLEDPTQPIGNVGNLTYILTREVNRYWVNSPRRYVVIAEILGALLCTILYFWHWIGLPYEIKKTKENGDVYDTTGI